VNAYLGLVLDFHVSSSEQLGVNPLGQSHEDVLPWSPDTHTQSKRSTDREDGVPDNVPQKGVQEEQTEVHNEHECQRKCCLVPAQCIAKDLVVTVLDLHAGHHLDRITERQRQEEVRFDILQPED
jgi:hypothetical protein